MRKNIIYMIEAFLYAKTFTPSCGVKSVTCRNEPLEKTVLPLRTTFLPSTVQHSF